MNSEARIKNLIKTTLRKGMQNVGHLMPTRKIPILAYHSIDESKSCLSVSQTNFQKQMTYLKEHGYRTISLVDFYDHMTKNFKVPDRTFVITFDDGYENNYEVAFPILKRLHFMATVFLATDYVGDLARWIPNATKRTEINHEVITSDKKQLPNFLDDDLVFARKRNQFFQSLTNQELKTEISKLNEISKFKMLSWDEIKEMSGHGIDFGAHTCSHPFLDELTASEARREIYESKIIIEKNINKEVTSFSYPYGVSTPKIRQLTNDAGYLLAVEDKVGLNNSKSDPCALKRILVGDVNIDEFAFYFSKGFSLYAGLQKQY